MSIENVNSLNPTGFKTNSVNNKAETVKSPEQIKDGDKKLKKALIALGTIAVAGAGIAIAYKAGKGGKLTEAAQNAPKKGGEIVQDTAGAIQKGVAEVSDAAGKAGEEIVQDTAGAIQKGVAEVSDAAGKAANEIHKAEIEAEALRRLQNEETAKQAAEKAQQMFNAPFESKLSHKSAEKSADVFIEAEKAKEKLEAAKKAYEQRLKADIPLEKRAEQVKGKYLGLCAETPSKVRIEQLNKYLSKEQITALDDQTIDMLLNNYIGRDRKMYGMKTLSSFSPEQLIKIQEDPYGRGMLNTLLTSPLNTQEDINDVIGWFSKFQK